jgi:hypothetical protein
MSSEGLKRAEQKTKLKPNAKSCSGRHRRPMGHHRRRRGKRHDLTFLPAYQIFWNLFDRLFLIKSEFAFALESSQNSVVLSTKNLYSNALEIETIGQFRYQHVFKRTTH